MKHPLNPEKSKKLRPLRIILAILIAVAAVLVLEKLPTSVKDRPSNNQTTTKQETSTSGKYYYLHGFLELIENQTEAKLKKLGVPEEEYKNLTEHFSKDELFELETKITLATNLDSAFVEADATSLKDLQKIFKLDDDYDFEQFRQPDANPSEYKILADLLAEYHKTLNTTEDYDVQEQEQ